MNDQAITDDSLQERRSDYDVSNMVQVSSPRAVHQAVQTLFDAAFPNTSWDSLWLAFHDFERLFSGTMPGYLGCDTPYHDIQHTLDMTLAMARLVAGYESVAEPRDRLGPQRAAVGIVTSLFHDAGYVRHKERDRDARNGAEYTLTHVSRSAAFLRHYLPRIGYAEWADIAAQIVHFTGYELNLDLIELDKPLDATLGHLLGTADLIAQMADRCYLEKCRDRLFMEFVVGNIAVARDASGATVVNYRSGRELLEKTSEFYEHSAKRRLEGNFNCAYRYVEPLFDGRNPYMEFIARNLGYLESVRQRGAWDRLRRMPLSFIAHPEAPRVMRQIAREKLQAALAGDAAPGVPYLPPAAGHGAASGRPPVYR